MEHGAGESDYVSRFELLARADGGRHLLTGSAGDVVADVQALGDLGVRHLFVNLTAETKEAMTARMERFAGEVMTAARGT